MTTVDLPETELTEAGAHLHSLLGSMTHGDGRMCAHHQRLGQWLVMTDPRDPELYLREVTYRCTREHS